MLRLVNVDQTVFWSALVEISKEGSEHEIPSEQPLFWKLVTSLIADAPDFDLARIIFSLQQ